MKKSTCLFCTGLLLFFYLQACQQPTSRREANIRDTVKAIDLSAPDIDKVFQALCEENTPEHRKNRKDSGMVVSAACAEFCFTAYKDTIKESGYLRSRNSVDSANRRSGRPRIKSFRLTTDAEFFSGTDFVCWLYQQHALAQMNNDTLETKIQLGTYTKDFFDCLASNGDTIPEKIQREKKNRISMFVVVYKKVAEKWVADPKVYDFGGLQP
jgi:hypothetical protein